MTDTAPFRHDLVQGSEGAEAFWVRASDGPRLRVAHHPSDGARGTVLMFPGRTEYIEKYVHIAVGFAAAGYHMATIDWRGQGMADRLLANPGPGHVGTFLDYQTDIAALLDFVRARGLPEPYYLVAHSMGGAIGLRALMEGLPVKAVVFSGPMWGINISAPLRPVAWGLGTLLHGLGLGGYTAPGADRHSYVIKAPFDDNQLTSDPAMYAMIRDHVIAESQFGLGGPTATWLLTALQECRTLAGMASPATPCVTYLGDNERIVDVPRIHDRMSRWSNGRLDIVPRGEHEILMERQATRDRVMAESLQLFEDNR